MIARRMQEKLQQGGGIRQAFNEAVRLKAIYGDDQVYDLSLGNPSAPVPEKVGQAMQEIAARKDLDHKYMSDAGYEESRQSITDTLNEEHQTAYTFENVIMTTGVAGGLNITMKALLDPEDEVIIFRPFYPIYASFTENHGATAVFVEPVEETFQPNLEDFKNKVTEHTKIVIVNSPHNPSGTIYTKETAEAIAAVLKEASEKYQHDIYILSDEPYRDLVFDGTELPWWPKIYANTIVSYSFSKSLSLAGERIGYLLVPSEISGFEQMRGALRIANGELGYTNAPAFFQRVVGLCTREKVDLDYYDRGRKLLYSELKRLGL